MTNKELQEILKKYPDDVLVAVECIDISSVTYLELNSGSYINIE